MSTCTLTAVLDPMTARVDLAAAASGGSPTNVTITRTHPSLKVVTVRSADKATLSGGVWVGYDYELPINRACVYTAMAYNVSGTLLATSDPVTVEWDTEVSWLKDPVLPARNIPINVSDPGDETFVIPTGVNVVIGRPTPIVITDVRQAATGQLKFATLNEDDAGTVHLLTSTGDILLLQTPVDFGIGNLYFAAQTVVSNRPASQGQDPTRIWTVTYVETDPPVGDVIGGDITYQTVLDTFATYEAVLDGESDYLGIAEGAGMGVDEQPTLAWRGA